MEIVVKIPDDMIKSLEQGNFGAKYNIYDLVGCLMNGTPLPEGHGNLIDYDDLIEKLDRYGRKNVKYQLPYSPTIIFADKDRKWGINEIEIF